MFIDIDDRHIRAFFGKCDRDRASYATVTAGDEGNLSLQLATPSIRRILCFGTRFQFIFHARLLILVLRRTLHFFFLSFLWHKRILLPYVLVLHKKRPAVRKLRGVIASLTRRPN